MTTLKQSLIAGITATIMLFAGSAFAGHKSAKTHFDAKDIQFKKTDVKGVSVITLWGEGNDAVLLLKMDAGVTMPWHSHTNRYWGMSIQGNWVHTDENRKEHVVTPGSYVTQKGEVFHGDCCVGTENCILLLDFEGARDLHLPKK